MHVVHYIRHLREEEGGVVRSVLDLTQALVAHQCRVTIITTDAGKNPPQTLNSEFGPFLELVELPRPMIGRFGTALRDRLLAIFATATTAHFHTIWDPHNVSLAAIAKKQKIGYVASTHGMLNDHAFGIKRTKKQLYLALAGKRFLHNAAALHCTASGERRQVESRMPGPRVEVIPLMFDARGYRNLPGREMARSKFPFLQRPGAKLLFLSRLHPIKGPEIAIEAVAQVAKSHDIQLVMAGPGEETYVNQLKALAREKGIEKAVSFSGMVSGLEKKSLYQACDLFVLPTQQENFGMVFPEALACGLPVITTDQVDTANELREAGARLVPRNVGAFVEVISELLNDPPSCEDQARRGEKYVFDWLDPTRVVDQYKSLYASATQRSGGSSVQVN